METMEARKQWDNILKELKEKLSKGDGNPLQYPRLENPIDREAWQATVHGIARVGHDSN